MVSVAAAWPAWRVGVEEGGCCRFPRLWRSEIPEQCFLSSFQDGPPPPPRPECLLAKKEQERKGGMVGGESNLGRSLPGTPKASSCLEPLTPLPHPGTLLSSLLASDFDLGVLI